MNSNSHTYTVEVYMCATFRVTRRIVLKMTFLHGDNIVVRNNLCFSYTKVRSFLITHIHVVGGTHDYILIF